MKTTASRVDPTASLERGRGRGPSLSRLLSPKGEKAERLGWPARSAGQTQALLAVLSPVGSL